MRKSIPARMLARFSWTASQVSRSVRGLRVLRCGGGGGGGGAEMGCESFKWEGVRSRGSPRGRFGLGRTSGRAEAVTRVVRVRRAKERVDSLAILRIGLSLRMWGLDCEGFRKENWLYGVGYET